MKKLLGMVVAGALAALALPSVAFAGTVNGGTGTVMDDPPITVGAFWFSTTSAPPAFFFGGVGSFNVEGPFTFASAGAVNVFVTDDFSKGDRFEVFDFGVSQGLTSAVATAAAGEVGPAAAFLDPTYSHGVFTLAAGAHSITIQAVDSPFGGGRAYIMVQPVVPLPGSALMGLGTLGGLGLVGALRRRRRAIA